MKYWIVYYDGKQYKLKHDVSMNETLPEIAMFRVFDMAYQYISVLNGRGTDSVYSRWMVQR